MDYLSTQSLPAQRASVRHVESAGLTMALVSHAPNTGGWFDPVEDLVVSVVVRSDRSRAERDIGFGKSAFTYQAGHVTLTPPERASYWRFDGNPLILHLGIPRHCLESLIGNLPGLEAIALAAARAPVNDPLIAQLADRLWTASEAPAARLPVFVEKGAAALLSLLLWKKADGGVQAEGQRERQTTLAGWRLKRAMDEISARKLRISVSEIAAAVELSPRHFLRAFKATTGNSPYGMASSLCIEDAKRLLQHTRRSMTDIALELGFSSSAHFATRFKQLVGMSPTAWRATHTM